MTDQTPFWWSLTNAQGDPVNVSDDLAGERFANQTEADGWIGDVFADLLAEGVDEVTLHHGDEKVYGPMSLHPGS
jgi:hypothetical protein